MLFSPFSLSALMKPVTPEDAGSQGGRMLKRVGEDSVPRTVYTYRCSSHTALR